MNISLKEYNGNYFFILFELNFYGNLDLVK
jgi:hypothetical protein